MALDKGDNPYSTDRAVVTRESDGSGSAGDAVKLNGSDQVTPTTANDDDVYGVLVEDSPSSGNDVAVVKRGPVIANAGGSVTSGDVLIADASTNGRLSSNADATGKVTDVDGTSDQGLFAPANPEAEFDSGGTLPDGTSLGTNEAVVWLK